MYGDVWIASSGFTAGEEMEIERSYYYEEYCEDEPDGISVDMRNTGGFDDLGGFVKRDYTYEKSQSDDEEGEGDDEKVSAGGNDDDNGNDSEISWSESEEEDSEMDMDDYSDMGDSIEPYYSERSQEEEDEMEDENML